MAKVVKFQKSMKSGLKEEGLLRSIVNDVKEQIGEDKLEQYKYDMQMLIDICNCVEKNVGKKSKKKKQKSTNKKDIVLKVFSDLYENIDLNCIDAQIETILNNKLVKKYDLKNRIYRIVSKFFLTD